MEVVTSLSQGRTAAAQCGLFTHKSVPVIFEPPCTYMVDYVIHPASYSQSPWFEYQIVARLLGLNFFVVFFSFPNVRWSRDSNQSTITFASLQLDTQSLISSVQAHDLSQTEY